MRCIGITKDDRSQCKYESKNMSNRYGEDIAAVEDVASLGIADSQNLPRPLEPARTLLCGRHQNQAESVVTDWRTEQRKSPSREQDRNESKTIYALPLDKVRNLSEIGVARGMGITKDDRQCKRKSKKGTNKYGKANAAVDDAASLDIADPQSLPQFRVLARTLLCWQHQDQAESVVLVWQTEQGNGHSREQDRHQEVSNTQSRGRSFSPSCQSGAHSPVEHATASEPTKSQCEMVPRDGNPQQGHSSPHSHQGTDIEIKVDHSSQSRSRPFPWERATVNKEVDAYTRSVDIFSAKIKVEGDDTTDNATSKTSCVDNKAVHAKEETDDNTAPNIPQTLKKSISPLIPWPNSIFILTIDTIHGNVFVPRQLFFFFLLMYLFILLLHHYLYLYV